jgi:hypothetical protein
LVETNGILVSIILMMQSAKADCCEMNVAYCKCSIAIWLAFIAIGFNQWNFGEYYIDDAIS